jgi:predicted nuclease of predicted toxin-antitoxin system
MKFLADMGIFPQTVIRLKREGYDAIHLVDEGLQRLEDREILEKARQEQRVILTVDSDFSQLLAETREDLPSVVFFRLRDQSRVVLEARLWEVLEKCHEDLEIGAIISVERKNFRVRRLPIA